MSTTKSIGPLIVLALGLWSASASAWPTIPCISSDRKISAEILYSPFSEAPKGWHLEFEGKSYSSESQSDEASMGQFWMVGLGDIRIQFLIPGQNHGEFTEILFRDGKVLVYYHHDGDSGRKLVEEQMASC